MTDNVVEFKKPTKDVPADQMFTLNMFQNVNGEYEVYMEVDDAYEDVEIFEAMIAAAFKFAEDNGLLEDQEGETVH